MRVNLNLNNFPAVCSGKEIKKTVTKPFADSQILEFLHFSPKLYADRISFKANNAYYPKEVQAQPDVLRGLINKYFSHSPQFTLPKFDDASKYTSLKVVSSGSAKNVAMMASDFINDVAGLAVHTEYASQAAHQKYLDGQNALVVAISQSGTTGDTRQALENVPPEVDTLALVNKEGTPIWNLAKFKVPVGAGEEKAIAATKSVTAQLLNLWMIALELGKAKGVLTDEQFNERKHEIEKVPANIERMFADTKGVDAAAEALKDIKDICILGRGANLGTALEGHLKIKEMTNKNTIAYAAGDFEHGPAAALKDEQAVIILMPGLHSDDCYTSAKNNLDSVLMFDKSSEIRAANKALIPDTVVIFKDENNKQVEEDYKNAAKNVVFIDIPHSREDISPMYNVVRFHQLSGKICQLKGIDQDGSRQVRLNKSITKEN